jgi:hypothetical protein
MGRVRTLKDGVCHLFLDACIGTREPPITLDEALRATSALIEGNTRDRVGDIIGDRSGVLRFARKRPDPVLADIQALNSLETMQGKRDYRGALIFVLQNVNPAVNYRFSLEGSLERDAEMRVRLMRNDAPMLKRTLDQIASARDMDTTETRDARRRNIKGDRVSDDPVEQSNATLLLQRNEMRARLGLASGLSPELIEAYTRLVGVDGARLERIENATHLLFSTTARLYEKARSGRLLEHMRILFSDESGRVLTDIRTSQRCTEEYDPLRYRIRHWLEVLLYIGGFECAPAALPAMAMAAEVAAPEGAGGNGDNNDDDDDADDGNASRAGGVSVGAIARAFGDECDDDGQDDEDEDEDMDMDMDEDMADSVAPLEEQPEASAAPPAAPPADGLNADPAGANPAGADPANENGNQGVGALGRLVGHSAISKQRVNRPEVQAWLVSHAEALAAIMGLESKKRAEWRDRSTWKPVHVTALITDFFDRVLGIEISQQSPAVDNDPGLPEVKRPAGAKGTGIKHVQHRCSRREHRTKTNYCRELRASHRYMRVYMGLLLMFARRNLKGVDLDVCEAECARLGFQTLPGLSTEALPANARARGAGEAESANESAVDNSNDSGYLDNRHRDRYDDGYDGAGNDDYGPYNGFGFSLGLGAPSAVDDPEPVDNDNDGESLSTASADTITDLVAFARRRDERADQKRLDSLQRKKPGEFAKREAAWAEILATYLWPDMYTSPAAEFVQRMLSRGMKIRTKRAMARAVASMNKKRDRKLMENQQQQQQANTNSF